MDLRKVKKLIELVEEAGIAELEVSSGDESIRIAMGTAASAGQVVSYAAPPTTADPTDAPTPAQPRAPATSSATVTAPMAGTFYAAAGPNDAPFVSVGQHVQAGDVLCIIESMKMMNEIRAPQTGLITGVLVTNGHPVATGEALFTLT